MLQITAGLLQIAIKCIIYYESSNILLKIPASHRVITYYIKNLLQITARITNCAIITNYVVTTYSASNETFELQCQCGEITVTD